MSNKTYGALQGWLQRLWYLPGGGGLGQYPPTSPKLPMAALFTYHLWPARPWVHFGFTAFLGHKLSLSQPRVHCSSLKSTNLTSPSPGQATSAAAVHRSFHLRPFADL